MMMFLSVRRIIISSEPQKAQEKSEELSQGDRASKGCAREGVPNESSRASGVKWIGGKNSIYPEYFTA
jgi:hypothetical protein